ncbi:MAG TPA: uridine kinase [Deltaproteobacteria bacterium]|nr:uridine kinase [Deltaproteobacteria bacterium]HPR56342.1 uridine kinase [Deltaproteobacteria bacterium]HXK46064.1 uridine kinase [Deltaproteobacteria bacterium]
MSLVRDKDGKRLHIKSRLMGESLVRKSLYDELQPPPQVRLFPDVNVVKIGGQSICDRGIKALPSIIREIASVKKRHKILLTAGGGTRSRHIYTIGLELGMPTGIIAKFASTISEQNALLLATLLASWDGIRIHQDDILKLPTYFSQGCIPVTHGMPPYDYFALPPEKGRLPVHRTDAGTLLIANLIGAKSCIFVKDEDGLYTDNPKTNTKATFIREIGVRELLKRDLEDLVVERSCLEILVNSEAIDRIQIVNGLKKGNISKALDGKLVGTVIYKD